MSIFSRLLCGVRPLAVVGWLATLAAPALSQATLYVTQDRELTRFGYNFVYVGIDANQKAYPGVQLIQNGADITDRLYVRHGGLVSSQTGLLNAAELRETSGLSVENSVGSVEAYDRSEVNLSGYADRITLRDRATLYADGFSEGFSIETFDSSEANLASTRFQSVYVAGGGTLNLNYDGIYTIPELYLYGATLNLNKGRLQTIPFFNEGRVNVSGGTLSDLTMTGGETGGRFSLSAGKANVVRGVENLGFSATITGGEAGIIEGGKNGSVFFEATGGRCRAADRRPRIWFDLRRRH